MPPPHPTLSAFVRGDASGLEIDGATVTSAIEHRLAGLVMSGVRNGSVSSPRAIERRLALHLLGRKQAHHTLATGLAAVAERLSASGVPWALFKGLGAEARWYDELGDRPATDVDIVIAPSAVPGAERLIAALDPDFAPADVAAASMASGRLQHIELMVDGVPVDLHSDFLKIGVPMRQQSHFWRSLTTVEVEGASYNVPSPEWALIGQVLHLNKDGFAFLGPFAEIARICEREPIDWELVHALVAGEGIETPFWCSLDRVCEVTGLAVPPTRPSALRHARTWHRLWPHDSMLGGREARRAAPRRQLWLAATTTGRPRATARELRRRLVPPQALFEVADGKRITKRDYVRHLTVTRARQARAERTNL